MKQGGIALGVIVACGMVLAAVFHFMAASTPPVSYAEPTPDPGNHLQPIGVYLVGGGTQLTIICDGSRHRVVYVAESKLGVSVTSVDASCDG